jgi:hypothetical protein
MGRFEVSRAGFQGLTSAVEDTRVGDRISAAPRGSSSDVHLLDGVVGAGEYRLIPGFQPLNGRLGLDKGDFDQLFPLTLTDAGKRFTETMNAPPFNRISPFDTPAVIDGKLNELETDLTQRRDRYIKLLNDATDPKMQAFYRDLLVAMTFDLLDVQAARGMKDPVDRGNAYNRIAHEAHIEVKYNVALLNGGGKPWSEEELQGLEEGLAKIPYKHTVESSSLSNIWKIDSAVINGIEAGGVHRADGSIEIADSASVFGRPTEVRETIVHEVGHSQNPEGALFDEFKALSGWKTIARQDDTRLAEFSTGDWVKASTLRERGFQVDGDDDQYFQISKSQGETLIVPSPPPPHPSDKFVSDYARKDPKEDFAESYAFYLLHPTEMKAKFPEKYDFMEKNFGPPQS